MTCRDPLPGPILRSQLPRVCVLWILLALVSWPAITQAHGRDTSHSQWQLTGTQLDVALRLAARDHARLGGAQQVASQVQVAGCQPNPEPPQTRSNQRGDVVLRWSFSCDPSAGPPRVTIALFEPLGPAHVHILSYAGLANEHVLTQAAPSATLAPSPAPASSWTAFVRLGFAHILEGWDHLAFVLALLLGAARLREVAILITGFTLGHSVTLALSALGLAQPDGASIELLIAASVVIVAAEDLAASSPPRSRIHAEQVAALFAIAAVIATVRGQACAIPAWGAALFAWGYLRRGEHKPAQPKPADARRLALVAGFGLIHGAGFAGVLHATGLPAGARVASLLSFNVGVELGQLCFVALAWPLLAYTRRRGLEPGPWIALALVVLGAAWVLSRVVP